MPLLDVAGLLLVSGAKPAPVTVTVLTFVPDADPLTSTVMLTVDVPLTAMVPVRLQTSGVPGVQPQLVPATDTYESPLGNVSESAMPEATDGPAFVTTMS